MDCYSAVNKEWITPFAATWMDPVIIILSEVSHIKTNIVWYHLHVESKNDTNDFMHRIETDSQTWKTNFCFPKGESLPKGKGGGKEKWGVWD